ncbi:MAG: thioredoxin-dependent thiol peroxidase [Brumimicrobium sp.]|nr:thioredoxin-dependent thiol peroxidase [Brumimicrobium sp.]
MITLKKGDKAPDFTAQDQEGRVIKLSDYIGKRVALYFYPKDMTPGCTNQACSIRDGFSTLKKEGVIVLGVSADDENKHQRFIEKYNLPFTLIADTDKKVIQLYGVWGPKSFMGKKYDGLHRTTFLINEDGTIHTIITKPNTKNHSEEIIEKFK